MVIWGGIAVRNKHIERSVVEGFLQQMVMGPLRQLKRTGKIERMGKLGRLDDDSWTRLRALLLNSGMIVVEKDLRLKTDQLVIKCRAGHPEWSGRRPEDKALEIRYSIKHSAWSIGNSIGATYPYRNYTLIPWRTMS